MRQEAERFPTKPQTREGQMHIFCEFKIANEANEEWRSCTQICCIISWGGGADAHVFPEEVRLVALVDPVWKGHPLKINSTSQQVGGSRITSRTCGLKV